jgi:uncharacterized phage infection (PIP) family protein YhgE
MTDIEQVFESAYAKAKAELLKEYNVAADTFQQTAHAVTGITPQVKKIVSEVGSGDIQDALPSTEDMLNTIKNLYAEIESLKNQGQGAFAQLAGNVAKEFAMGGDPVSHTLHLANGTVIEAHQGLATHVALSDGSVQRVIAAYPTNEVPAKV